MAAVPTVTGVVPSTSLASAELAQGTSELGRIINPADTPFLSVLQNLPQPPAKSTLVVWTEDRHRYVASVLAASASANATTFTVLSGDYSLFRAGDLVAMASGEVVSISAVSADDVLTVNRSVGSIAAASAASGSGLLILGKSYAQGASYPTPVYVPAITGSNYTQIFREPFALTKTAEKINVFGSKESLKQIANSLVAHRQQIENTLFFGTPTISGYSGSEGGTMGGIAEFVGPLGTASTPLTLTAATVGQYFSQAVGFGGGDKAFFCGPRAASGLFAALGQNWEGAKKGDTFHGVQPAAYANGPWGRYPVFIERGFASVGSGGTGSEAAALTGRGMSSCLFLVDLADVALRPLRKTKLHRGRLADATDSEGFEWITETSLEVAGTIYQGGSSAAHVFLPLVQG